MRFFPKNCCSCFKLRQGFTYIIYGDILRLAWNLILMLLIFLKDTCTLFDYIFDGEVILFIIIQSFHGLLTLNTGYQRDHYPIHRKYLLSKIYFFVSNILKLAMKPRLNCFFLKHLNTTECVKSQLDGFFCVDLIWTLFELYFITVVYTVGLRVRTGFYEPQGGSFVYLNLEGAVFCTKAIDLEVNGVKTIEKGQPIELATSMERRKKVKKSNYFKIFPKPIIKALRNHNLMIFN